MLTHGITTFGITWYGLSVDNARKLILSLIVLAVVTGVSAAINFITRHAGPADRRRTNHWRFWVRQATRIIGTAVAILGVASVWFTDPGRLATAFGLVSAGLAFALQRVITSIAGYFVILRSNSFTVGDRISMGGVRGDVMALGFIQTTIMEMGQPDGLTDPAQTWVRSRQFTGRIVTVSNAKIFDDPVFNYTRSFPYIWEEIMIPVTYTADRARAEAVMLDAARDHAVRTDALTKAEATMLHDQFGVEPIDLEPTGYMRLTDNWIELTVRFIVHDHRVRQVKSDMSRQIIAAFDAAKIGVASSTYDIVGFPALRFGEPVQGGGKGKDVEPKS